MTTVETVERTPVRGKGKGFASMSPERRREISQRGGEIAHLLGRAHQWTSEEAREAGRKGGTVSRRRPKPREGVGQ